MAEAMKLAVEAGRLAFEAGRIPRKPYASASSPLGRCHRARGGAFLMAERAGQDEPAHERLDATLERLARERLDADRRYNDALTALDARRHAAGGPAVAAGPHRRPSTRGAQPVLVG